MAPTLVFLLVRHVLRLVGLGPRLDDKGDAVMRHQLAVLHRQVVRPRYAPTDRLVLATLHMLLLRERWSACWPYRVTGEVQNVIVKRSTAVGHLREMAQAAQ